MNIILNEAEQKLAIYLATRRNNEARNQGITNEKQGPQKDEEIELEGIAGEIAFCKIFNVYPDCEIGPGTRNYADAFTVEGSYDIKTTKYPKGRLIVARFKKNREHPDYYALMIGTFPEYTFMGMIRADEVFKDENLKDVGHGPCYVIEQLKLFRN